MIRGLVYLACIGLAMRQENGVLAAKSVKARGLRQAVQSKATAGCMTGTFCPDGKYLETCSNCYTDVNGILYCTCPSNNGNVDSSLQNSFACSANIVVSSDGKLTCGFVPGNYGLSCRECTMIYKDSLSCSCPNDSGMFGVSIMVSASTCTYAENINGAIVCTARTPAPTTSSPTPQPTGDVQCVWSSQTEMNGESTPTSACDTKTTLQGCEYNNFCCWNYDTSTCQPVPGCPNCLSLSLETCSSAPSGCCTFDTNLQQCIRTCPLGQVNVDMCPGG